MFDWDDEELENIIWGDEGESEDHIVPYPKLSKGRPPFEHGDQNKKEWKQESAALKSGHNTSEDQPDFQGCQQKNTSNFGSNDEHSTSGFCIVSWPELSSSNVAETDQDMGEEAPFEKHTEIVHSGHENKEHDDYVDYDWANIGSFDDLDRIFSNDDPIFGRASLDNADTLWSSSKEAGDIPVNFLPLSADSSSLGVGVSNIASENNEVKSDCGHHVEQPFSPGYSKWSDSTSHNLQPMHGSMDKANLDMTQKTTTPNFFTVADNATALNKLADKVGKRKKVEKYQKNLGEKSASRVLHDSDGTLSLPGSQFLRLKTQVSPPVFLACQSEPFQYQNISSPHLASSAYRNPTKQCTPQTMTPREKIEKLRRRQQMQAMLAIQKQHQQLNNLVPSANPTIKKNQIPFTGGDNVEVGENLRSFPSLDPDSTMEQGSSDTVSMVTDNYSPEESIFYQLQDAIAKLDIKARLCIRDSMFRLAQSSVQRHCEIKTSSFNKNSRNDQNVTSKEESDSYRLAKIPDVETDTNPVDRTVAQLLFYRPLEISSKQTRTPVPIVNFPRNSKNIQSVRRSITHCQVEDSRNGDQYIKSPCVNQNAANNGPLDGGAMEVGTSC